MPVPSPTLDQVAHALEHMAHGFCVVDADDRLTSANTRFAEVWGAAPCSGATFAQYVSGVGATELPLAEPGRRMWRLSDGRIVEVMVSRIPAGGWVGLCDDATERHETATENASQARHDPLTGLAGRELFHERLERRVAHLEPDEELAVVYLDLDHFKSVNDTLGHPVGDRLLIHVAERLRAAVRADDVIARLGGDEFAIVQVGTRQPSGATGLARRLIERIAEPFDVSGHVVHTGTSIGIAIAPFDGASADELLKNADMALYSAKGDGRGALRFFEPEMDRSVRARRDLELDLRRAISSDELDLYYQPLVDLSTDQISGFEALIRWHHPERGMVSPDEFIPLAEETGLIVEIGRWVLQRACRDAASWPQPVRVAVNVSPAQFKSHSLVRDVLSALSESGLSPHRLDIEITETAMLTDTDYVLTVLHDLKDRGVRISMDDFGTGYSSLSYLRRFPFDKIKIDRSFIRDVELGGEGTAIVRAVSGLGQTMGITTTAEGVETAEQLEAVRSEGCGEIQGYLISRPQPADEVAGLLARHGASSPAAPTSTTEGA
jgi:diguanylate cyclase (GGDEF)-like protein